jgi:hypothetical protein
MSSNCNQHKHQENKESIDSHFPHWDSPRCKAHSCPRVRFANRLPGPAGIGGDAIERPILLPATSAVKAKNEFFDNAINGCHQHRHGTSVG